jgi:uncharacterized protein
MTTVTGERLMNLQVPALPPKSSSKIETPQVLLKSDLPDSAGAHAYAFERLKRELPDFLQYHTLYHTQMDVLPALERLAWWEKIDGEPLILLRTATIFHDIGFVIQCDNHEEFSMEIAAEILPFFRYNQNQIKTIQSLISTTKIPQLPHTILDQIIADADLDVLGRNDFMARNLALRAELLALGKPMTDIEWYTSQLRFITSHRYFTKSARSLRNSRKQKNITDLERRLHLALST